MLILNKLYLDGWLSYKQAIIKLNEPGVTLVSGEIGAGKSAILEAIFYLLFGKTLRGKDSVNSLANKILNKGYDIRLSFSINGHRYIIREVRKRKNSGLWFYRDKKPLVGKTDTETRKLIISELGMGPEDFRSIAFLGQRQSQIIIEGTPGERAKNIVSVFGLGVYDDSIKRIQQDIGGNEQESAILDEKIHDSQIVITEISEGLADFQKKDEKDLQRQSEAVFNEIKSLEAENKRLGEKISSVVHEIDHIDEVKRNITRLEIVNKEISELEQRVKSKNSDDGQQICTEIDKLSINKGKFRQKLNAAMIELEKIEHNAAECPISNEKCPVGIPQKFFSSRKRDLTKKINKYSHAARKIVEKLADLNQKRVHIDRYTRAKNDLSNKLQMKKVIEEFLAVDGALPREDMQQLSKHAVSLNTKLRDLRDKFKEIAEKCNEKREEYAHIKAEIIAIETQRKAADKLTKLKNEKEEKLKDLMASRAKLTIEMQYLAAALDVFKKTKMYKIDLVLETLNFYVNEILNEISNGKYQAEFTSQRENATGTRKLDRLGITVHDKNKSIPIELCSGGQVTEVGLAVLLSMWRTARMLSDKSVSSLWLDEVFGPLNEEIINKVFSVVVDTAKEGGATSIKVISHRGLDSRIVDHVWNVALTNGISSLQIS